jgi:hypothetical protein
MSGVMRAFCSPISRTSTCTVGRRLERPIHIRLKSSRGSSTERKLRLVDGLHSKLCWVERRGYVITSANLSSRALGQTVQQEIGVFSSNSDEIPIDQVISRLKSRPLAEHELRRLQRQHDDSWARIPPQKEPKRAHSGEAFDRWYGRPSERRRRWKLGWFDETGEEAPSTARLATDLHGPIVIEDYIDCNEKDFQPSDWVLSYRISRTKVGSIRLVQSRLRE